MGVTKGTAAVHPVGAEGALKAAVQRLNPTAALGASDLPPQSCHARLSLHQMGSAWASAPGRDM